MKSPLTLASAAIVGIALSSCYPIPGPPPEQQQPEVSQAELEAQERERDRLARAEAELLRQQQQFQNPPSNGNDNGTGNSNTDPVGPTDYPFASKVPGKAGFVFSPYNKQVVDVRDIPSGTLVQDPTYPASEKKYFRVP